MAALTLRWRHLQQLLQKALCVLDACIGSVASVVGVVGVVGVVSVVSVVSVAGV